MSYERFLDVVYDHLMQVYEPVRLRLVFETRPRGGISSKLTVDSDWAIRGGREQFQDWRPPGRHMVGAVRKAVRRHGDRIRRPASPCGAGSRRA